LTIGITLSLQLSGREMDLRKRNLNHQREYKEQRRKI